MLLLGVVVIGGTLAVQVSSARFEGWFGAADYPALAANRGWGQYGLPSVLPPGASNVIIYAPGAGFNIMPVQDEYVEVRFVMPPADAAALLKTAELSAITPPNVSYAILLDSLSTADDRDRQTPLPRGFRHTILKNPSSWNAGGVSINPETGEVVYWIFET